MKSATLPRRPAQPRKDGMAQIHFQRARRQDRRMRRWRQKNLRKDRKGWSKVYKEIPKPPMMRPKMNRRGNKKVRSSMLASRMNDGLRMLNARLDRLKDDMNLSRTRQS